MQKTPKERTEKLGQCLCSKVMTNHWPFDPSWSTEKHFYTTDQLHCETSIWRWWPQCLASTTVDQTVITTPSTSTNCNRRHCPLGCLNTSYHKRLRNHSMAIMHSKLADTSKVIKTSNNINVVCLWSFVDQKDGRMKLSWCWWWLLRASSLP